jgi:predicted negative regulator of RcsB-dependent stress response
MMQNFRLTRFADNSFQVVVFIMLLGLVAAAGWYTYTAEQVANKSYSTVVNAVNGPSQQTQNFNACVAAGNPVSQTSPETCTNSAGQTYTQ